VPTPEDHEPVAAADLVVYVDRSRILPGRLDELRPAMANLVAFVEAHEPQILSYAVYFSEDGERMTVVHAHVDASSLAFHLDVAGPEFPAVGEFIELETIDVYGRPSPAVVAELREKASALGTGRVAVHPLHAGVSHLHGR